MPLKNFTRSIVLVGLATVYAPSALAKTTAEPPVKAAPARSHSDAPATLSGDVQDDLIGEILGVAGAEPATEPTQPDAAPSKFKFVVVQPETSARPPSTKPSRQNGYGSMFGRVIRIDLDTNTVDIQFEGRRQTTVGSKFSVEHDYAFTTEYLGKLEIVYLAGGNRAIAKPSERTDITRMGKGDRVGGRVVPNQKGSSAGGGGSSAQGGASGTDEWQSGGGLSPAPSCVKPQLDNMPVPPPDPTTPYAPESESMPEEPGPTPGITQPSQKPSPLAAYRSVLKGEPSPAPANTVRQKASAAVTQRPSAPSAMRPVRTTALAAKPKNAVPSPRQHAEAPLAVRVKPDGPGSLAPREKWTGVTARTWDALIKPNRNSPATILLTRQSVKTAEFAGSATKSLWCAAKPKAAAETANTAALPTRPAQQPTILLFESE